MKDLYFLDYNNYFNRQVKKLDTLQEYLDESNVMSLTNVNFIPGDGVSATQVVNYQNLDMFTPDYLLVCEGQTIESRWFIMEHKRLAGNQYRLQLRRDLVADNYDKLLLEHLFVEKATLDPSDPAVYNKENMTFNQIKKSETLIKDASNIPWIVGYVARDHNEDQNITSSTYSNDEYSDLNAYPYKSFIDKLVFKESSPVHIDSWWSQIIIPPARIRISEGKIVSKKIVAIPPGYRVNPIGRIKYIEKNVKTEPFPNITYSYDDYQGVSDSKYLELLNEQDKILKVGNIYYKVNLETSKAPDVEDSSGKASVYMRNLAEVPGNPYTYYSISTDVLKLTLTEINELKEGVVQVPFSKPRAKCTDQPYDIFTMPYNENNMAIAGGLASLGEVVYDVQLVPYCPLLKVTATPDKSTMGIEDYYDLKVETETIGTLFWCSRSRFSFKVPLEVELTNIKMQNETDLWRFCSPNYQGAFDINLAKNTNDYVYGMNWVDVDVTYKPYQPYIKLAPNFGGLYGRDYNDARGLICGGDFSIPSITDRWASYQINNKNYKESFDRNIETVELNNKWQMVSDIMGAGTNTAAGGIMGAFAKLGPIATVGGAAAGAIDGTMNAVTNAILRKDALDNQKDQFGYQMSNIQALPNTINKIGNFNNNSKLFPFMEYYSCTETEKTALELKLKYNGMSVGRIGTISEFQRSEPTFIKGQLIRMEYPNMEYHELAELNAEVMKGMFI